jgi:hypothetical protein
MQSLQVVLQSGRGGRDPARIRNEPERRVMGNNSTANVARIAAFRQLLLLSAAQAFPNSS